MAALDKVYAKYMSDDTMIEIECPACRRKIKRPLARLRRNPKLQCPTCYRTIIPSLELSTRDLEPHVIEEEAES